MIKTVFFMSNGKQKIAIIPLPSNFNWYRFIAIKTSYHIATELKMISTCAHRSSFLSGLFCSLAINFQLTSWSVGPSNLTNYLIPVFTTVDQSFNGWELSPAVGQKKSFDNIKLYRKRLYKACKCDRKEATPRCAVFIFWNNSLMNNW